MNKVALTIPGTQGTPIQIQLPTDIPTGGLYDPMGGFSLIELLLTTMFTLASVIAVIMILYAGIQWIVSGGDKSKIEGARNRITYAIVGLVIVVMSFFIVRTVITLLGGNPDFFLP